VFRLISRELLDQAHAFYRPQVDALRGRITILEVQLEQERERYERLVERMMENARPREEPVRSEPAPSLLPPEVQRAVDEWAYDPIVHAHVTRQAMIEMQKPNADAGDIARRISEGEPMLNEEYPS
jgi:hypothetical protein